MVKNVYFCNMLQFENQKIKHIVRKALPVIALVAILYSCASIGRPEGGPKDYDPPRFVGSTPAAGAINNKRTKVSLQFDEFIKLEKATEKVVVSPPQIQQPEIKASGKKIQVNLLDSLKPNTTYTIDFSDAIVDNNEGNPLGNFAFTFSKFFVSGKNINEQTTNKKLLNVAKRFALTSIATVFFFFKFTYLIFLPPF